MEPLSTTHRQWYVVLTYLGNENKVKKNLERRILSLDAADYIFRVAVPPRIKESPSIQIRPGQAPQPTGYVLVEKMMDERSWHIVRNTPGVAGFLVDGDNRPVPVP
jgi:transcription termination/antitermination protein NusG